MKSISTAFLLLSLLLPALGCRRAATAESAAPAPTPDEKPLAVAPGFAYPVGPRETVTQAKDARDAWYNAQDFGANDHLGEDWNLNSGGNTDCGETVYAVADGRITYAADAGPGWGNVVIVEHALANGKRVESLYGHLQKIHLSSGDVRRRQPIGEVGNADGKYLCHLHFEIRTPAAAMWRRPGVGYSPGNAGWLDPSDFIDRNR